MPRCYAMMLTRARGDDITQTLPLIRAALRYMALSDIRAGYGAPYFCLAMSFYAGYYYGARCQRQLRFLRC